MIDLVGRSLDESPPPERTRLQNHPTLLISWWCTGFALFLILLRLWGRWVRTDRFFREDKIMALSIAPLLIRMALVDPILLYGTNSSVNVGISVVDIHYREIGSRLVLASRIFYALFIWIAKFTVSEYLKRLTCSIWTRKYDYVLMGIRVFLTLTFVAVVIATLAECQPFSHYWQVVPDPGPHCRDGFTQLITMGVCDGVTDILLIVFPIPIVWSARMPFLRKISLCTLFSLSSILIVITAYRVPAIINSHNNQQLRTLWASFEILAATAVSNALILGSFVRDRGVKKAKYTRHLHSRNDSSMDQKPTINRVMTKKHWGSDSDENLFSTVRGRLGTADHSAVTKPDRVIPARCGNTYRESAYSEESYAYSDDTKVGHSFGSIDSNTDDMKLFDIGGALEAGPPQSQPSSPQSTKGLVQHAAPPSTDRAAASPDDFVDAGGLLSSPVLSPPPKPKKLIEPRFPPSVAVADSASSIGSAKVPDEKRRPTFAATSIPDDCPPAYGSARAGQQHNSKKQDSLDLGDAGGLLSATRVPPKPSRNLSVTVYPRPGSVARREDPGSLMSILNEGPPVSSIPAHLSPQTSAERNPAEGKPAPLDFQDIGNLINSPLPPASARHDWFTKMKAPEDRRQKTRPQSEAEETKCAREILGKIKDVRNLPPQPMSPARRLASRAKGNRLPPPGPSGLRQHPVSPRFDVTREEEEEDDSALRGSPTKLVSPNTDLKDIGGLLGGSGL